VPYKDIQNRTAPLNIFIGQYSGMDFGIKDDSYFGKATYNLKLLLPEKIQSYTLELPEIFSSYELYINGNLLAKCGDINNATYKEATKKSSVSFLAQKSIDITLYVSNYSHIYGGLVYPPAFGTQEGISKLLTGRIIFNSMFLFISLTLCILFLLAGLKINKIYSIYALLTLVFIGYTSYPITHSLFTTSIWTYHIEIFCYYLFIALVLYLQNKIFVIEDKDKIIYTYTFNFHNKAYNTVQILNTILLSVSCIIILFTFLPAKVICMNTVTLTLYSLLLTGYKYSVFLYLIVTTFIATINNIKYSKLLLSGFCIVAASFFADRIFSLFEPIHFAWFYEISGFILICIIGLILIMTFSEIYIKNQKLNTQIDMQKSYYSLVSENIYNTRKMRHDLRNHILVIKTFLEEKNISKLYNYIENNNISDSFHVSTADEFIQSRINQINTISNRMDKPPIIVCPFDAELFRHWWYDGPKWLEAFLRKSANLNDTDFELITPGKYLEKHPVLQVCEPAPNSWGRWNYNNFWLNETNDYI
jgi:hypothetical protein